MAVLFLRIIGIHTNIQKDQDLNVTRYIIAYLIKNAVQVRTNIELAGYLGMPHLGLTETEMQKSIEILIVLGGDGTILNASRIYSLWKIPILGVNLGHLGFLSEIEVADIEDGIEKFLIGNFHVEERMMLCANTIRNGQTGENLYALNDIGIARNSLSRMIHIEVYINDNYVDRYPADGFIVSSPTGSTAYSLSAGGPIISPNMHCLLLTPICPHTLHSRPIVIADHEIVRLKVINQNQNQGIVLTLDGQQGHQLLTEDWVVIKKAQNCAQFIRVTERNFYTLLRKKLSEWSGSNEE